MLKKLLALLMASALCLSLTACDDEDWEDDWEDDSEQIITELIGESGDPNQTWAIYWYLCGSDLESEVGFASGDMEEMLAVDLPENVQVIVQTGGAEYWQNEVVDPYYTERYLYDSEGLQLVDQQPMSNMGDPETLADFLWFCTENFPADRTAVVFWNHGGGSVAGASFDENYYDDSLTLSEMYDAFHSVYEASANNPPVDIIGFDTCLMGTIDTAATFNGIGHYLVASEELEPGGGWEYTGFLQALADDPGMDGARLGQMICDTYMEGCGWSADEATLSVVDLTRIDPLLVAYENLGAEALGYALEDPGFFGDFGRQAVRTENYGGNTRDQGYTNMLDLGHLALNCSEILPQTSIEVLDALEDCVLYNVRGDYRENATGLSCYFSYNGDTDDLEGYRQEGCSETFKYFFGYGIEGELPPEGMEYIQDIGYAEEDIQEVPDLESSDDYEYPLYLDDDGVAVMELDQDIINMLKGVYFQLAYMDADNDILLMLGQDNNIESDWENGVFRDTFQGYWGAIDDHLVYMEVSYEAENYTAYSVPILLNGEEYNLRVIYDDDDGQYYIMGARRGLTDSGMADKNLVQLRPGDEITTVHYASTISGDDDFEPVEMETFTVTEDTYFADADMGDGTFLMMFELVDAKNNIAYSQTIMFDVVGDEITVEILDF